MNNTNDTCCSTSRPLNIRLHERVPGEKEIYVNSVCGVLIESRFGPGRTRPIAIRLTDWPELEPAVFYEMSATGPTPAYTILPDSEMAFERNADAPVRNEGRIAPRFAFIQNLNISSSNHARGSPWSRDAKLSGILAADQRR